MTEPEKDSCRRSSFWELIQGLRFEELSDSFIFLVFFKVVILHGGPKMRIDETRTECLALGVADFEAAIFVLLIVWDYFRHLSEVCFPIDCCEVDLKEEVEHVRLATFAILDVWAALVDEFFLLDWYHIAHINADFKLAQIRESFVFFTPRDRIEEHARLADLKIAHDFSMLSAVVHLDCLHNILITHKERKLSQVNRCCLFLLLGDFRHLL